MTMSTRTVQLVSAELGEAEPWIRRHLQSLTDPMDSWLEDQLRAASLSLLVGAGDILGYAAQIEDTLHFFHVKREHFRWAPAILEQVVSQLGISKVFVMTQDSLLGALMAEWDYAKQKVACWFTDSGVPPAGGSPPVQWSFRLATLPDAPRIQAASGDFFAEASGGFTGLPDRLQAETLFLLEDGETLLGCGVIEQGRFVPHHVSIGMYVPRSQRRRGVGRALLLHLKDWAYGQQLIPVSGCWYYNTLSRKTLESAGMMVTAIGYVATLRGKETLPLRTGNPPGELVE